MSINRTGVGIFGGNNGNGDLALFGAGTLYFGGTTGGLMTLEGTTPADGNQLLLGVQDPTHGQKSMKFPNINGDSLIVVSDTSFTTNPVVAKCGNVSVDPPSISLTSTGVATASVTGLAANDVCACAARTNFDDDLVPHECFGTSNTLNIRIYNPTLGSIDAGAQTVDYCCYAK
jgi:hypothetical protein